ncbi:MAG: crotonase/enoyl-CoA hydratase family protein [Deltaproteobacteria bacterium]|nr:crotonase/enoyl-CoA hydratase family protein [Deltaproteobacteria bacterium]
MSEPILAEARGHILLVSINRPEARNAFDGATAAAMEAAMDRFEEDSELRVGIITGAGKAFSAGQDLKAAAKGDMGATRRRGGFGIMARPPNKPLIAAVEGHAVAGGLELCLSCDLIVAARDARMGIPEARHNLVAVGGGLFRLPRRIPYHLVMELALTADTWTAERMHEIGLVNRLAEPGQALDVAFELAERVLANGPLAVAASKQIVQRSSEWTEEEAWREQMKIAGPVMQSEDTREGLAAFAQKRAPVWKGR